MSLLNFEQDIFGIDISDSSLKIAKIKKIGDKFSLESFGSFTIQNDIIINGQIKKPEILSELIKNSLLSVQGKRINSKYVALGLPEEKVFLGVIERPDIESNQIDDFAKIESEKYIPLPINDVYLDCQEIESNGKKYILLAAIAKEIADSFAQCLEMAGLDPVVFEPKTQSISRSLISTHDKDETIAIIDMGARRTIFSIINNGYVNLSATINLSGNNLSQSIAQELGITFKEADVLKNQYPEISDIKKNDIVKQKIDDYISDLCSQIKNYINFYKEKPYASLKGVNRILISGGGANIFEIDKKISLNLGIDSKIANPWVNIMGDKFKEIPPMSFAQSQSYSVALGLALRAAKFEI